MELIIEDIRDYADCESISNLFQNEVCSYIKENNFTSAIITLQKCEMIYCDLESQGTLVDPDLILAILHNLAMCYQR